MSVNQELKLAIEQIKVEYELTQAEIAVRLGRNSTYLSGVINGHMPFTEKLRDELYKEFHIWIILPGEEVRLEEYHLIDTDEKYQEAMKAGLKMLPEVDFSFSAGTSVLVNSKEKVERYWYLPDCEDCEAVVPMVGNSMLPTFPAGCDLVLKRYGFDPSRPTSIPFGNVFGIILEDRLSGAWHGHIKVIRRHKCPELAKQYWIAHSLNTEEFDDFDIEISQVRGLWVVKQHVVLNTLL